MSTPNRVPAGVSTGGQFATGQKAESGATPLSPAPAAAAPVEEPNDFRSALHAGHRHYTDQGVPSAPAAAYLVAVAAKQLAEQHATHAQTAGARGDSGHALGYMQSYEATRGVLKAAAEHTEDPQALTAAVTRAKNGLDSSSSLFQGFGPNPVTNITGETRRFLDDIEGFLGDVHQD